MSTGAKPSGLSRISTAMVEAQNDLALETALKGIEIGEGRRTEKYQMATEKPIEKPLMF